MINKKTASQTKKSRSLRRFKFAALLIMLPVAAASLTFYYIFSNTLAAQLGNRGNNQLITANWQTAQEKLAATQPQYGTKFAYYKLQPWQNLDWAASHFGVSLAKLKQLNPGSVVAGTTIMVPPVEQPLTPITPSNNLATLVVQYTQGVVYVSNSFQNPEVHTTIPQLMQILKPYGAIEQTGPKVYRLMKPLYIQDNIRIDITDSTVSKLELKSAPNFDIVALTLENSEALIQNTAVTSVDPSTGKPDTTFQDGRSFVRAYKNSRMDIMNSNMLYLGMDVAELRDPAIRARIPFVPSGGVYGVSWRTPTGSFGQDIVTGWVQNSTFEHNHYGGYTFGASGMTWRNNLFTENDVYGLDPHDDSNNATIEYNRFISNGKHGFIVSKRCDYNLIRNNISIDNKLHGFMLHENSNYNLMENNISIGNGDNFVVYNSSLNTIRNNKSYSPNDSHIRLNADSTWNFIQGNTLYSGSKGIYVYDNVNGVDIANNTFFRVNDLLITNKANRVVYTGNQSEKIGYVVNKGDRVIFGQNTINKNPDIDLRPLQAVIQHSQNLRSLTLDIL